MTSLEGTLSNTVNSKYISETPNNHKATLIRGSQTIGSQRSFKSITNGHIYQGGEGMSMGGGGGVAMGG